MHVILFWLSLAGETPAHAREIVREAGRISPPEAWYVFDGARGTAWCEMTVIVGPDGMPIDARPENCPDVLLPALVDAAMRWRWAEAPDRTAESIALAVAAPSFPPRGKRCLLGFAVTPSGLQALSVPSRRCSLQPRAIPAASTAARRSTAWCAVDIVTDETGVRSIDAPLCAEGFADSSVSALRTWDFPVEREQHWRLLVGYLPEGR